MINKRNTLVGPQLQRGFRTVLQPDWKKALGGTQLHDGRAKNYYKTQWTRTYLEESL